MAKIYLLTITVLVVIGRITSSPAIISNNATHVEEDEIADAGWEYENTTVEETRRILFSKKVAVGKRPYMVYLQLTQESAKAHKYRGWLCGGVILDKYYVLTSAACVEDADHFYIVSGTTKFVDSFDYKKDACVSKHRRKVVWKCIPKNYKFDFQDSIKWSANDIAIVKVNKPFKLGVCEKGCQFATDIICYNNISRELEKAGTKGFITGWGSGSNFREGVYRRQQPAKTINAKCLQEAKVCIMDNELCSKKWAQRFRTIITTYMICTKDVMKRLSEVCDKRYANCTEIESRRNDDEDVNDLSSNSINIDLGRHLRDPDDYAARRSSLQGGFCENDHGGPMIVKHLGKERVVGVISACKIDPKSHSCHGPFLYTSVFKNRQFISCAIHKDVEENCRRVFRTGITHEEWTVDWDNVKEDKEDDADSDDEDDDEDENKNAESKDEEEEKDIIRAKKEKKKVEEEKSDSSSSESEEEKKPAKKEKPKHERKQEKVSSHTQKEKSTKTQIKRNKTSKKVKAKEVNDKDPASYESTSEENVNNPKST